MGVSLSLIIPTYNRADLLASTLKALASQALCPDQFEVLIIDNGSTDNTPKVINDFHGQVKNLRGIYVSEPGLHVGRHEGMRAASNDVLVFADDDIEPLPPWLESISAAFTDPDVAMVGGNNYPMFVKEPPQWLLKMWERRRFRGYRAIPPLSVIEFLRAPRKMSPYLVWGCNFAIRRQTLLDAGGFHPDAMPGELLRFRGDGETHVSRYVASTGRKCLFHPGASVYHKVVPTRMTFQYFRERGFNQGVSDSYTMLRNQHRSSPVVRRNLLFRVLRRTIFRIIELFDDAQVREAVSQMAIGHNEGFAYHQSMYRKDPEVRQWVHRPTYF